MHIQEFYRGGGEWTRLKKGTYTDDFQTKASLDLEKVWKFKTYDK